MPIPADFRGLLTAKLVPMSAEISDLRLKLTVMEMDEERCIKMHDEMGTAFPYQVIYKRFLAAEIPVTTPLTVFLSLLCDNPAQLVLWAYTLCWIWKDLGYREKPIEFRDWSAHFNMGVPEESEYDRLWDLQKCTGEELKRDYPSNNWLDNFAVWPLPPLEDQTI